MSVESAKRSLGDVLAVHGSALLVALLLGFVAFQFVDPAPPKRITMAAGAPGGAYFQAAQAYQQILAAHGVELEVRASAGSVENLGLLTAASGDTADVALVQGGVRRGPDREVDPAQLVSLASVYREPLWVFYRTGFELARLADLAGARVAVGPPGSGTRALALRLLAENGIMPANTSLLDVSSEAASAALAAGEIDAVLLVAGADSSLVHAMLADPGVRLMSFDRAEAYVRRNGFLSAVTLPEGTIDLAANVPRTDITLVAASANLVARADLHPALVDLLLLAAEQVHAEGGVFESQGQFPSDLSTDFPLSKEARRYFKSGPPLLMRSLPFWAATLLDRLKVMLLPLIALLLPLAKVLPPVYRWRVRSRIYRWYGDLRAVEASLHDASQPLAPAQLHNDLLASLARIEQEVRQVSVPPSYEEELYHLRMHLDFVRGQVNDVLLKNP